MRAPGPEVNRRVGELLPLSRDCHTPFVAAAPHRPERARMPETVLVVDDEPDLLNLLRHNLRRAGLRVIVSVAGDEALRLIPRERPDVIVLDVLLPGMDGFEVCRALKKNADTAAIPILMLTAKAEHSDKIIGLEHGADDYMTKPFDPRELVLRVQAILRRTNRAPAAQLEFGKFVLDPRNQKASVAGEPLQLTPLEFKLLALLLENHGRVQTRETLLRDVWGYSATVDTRTVDAHMRRLRNKVGDHASCIETVRSEGYRVVLPIAS